MSDLPAFANIRNEFKFCPTVLFRPDSPDEAFMSSIEAATPRLHSAQKFNHLHRVYGKTLQREHILSNPFYALKEVYAFAAAAENQYLNMVDQMISERIDILARMPAGTESPSSSDIQYDRNILDTHRVRIRATVVFLTAYDDPVWFQPFKGNASDETFTARVELMRDFQYLEQRIVQLILRCERGMEMLASNASLSEARQSNTQSEGLAKLTRLTTFVTILYVPLSYVSSFFGMNFSTFGQGDVKLWVWAVVSVPIFIVSLFFALRQS
jgi:Mg2+ and Co2+ transporter CorA